MTAARRPAREAAERFCRAHHAQAAVTLLAGSCARGDETPQSDLDLVIVYDRLDHAWRESFVFEEWPVETFVHDPETLRHFFVEVDRATGVPSLAAMVAEGIELDGPTQRSRELKQLANEVLAAGPPVWSDQELRTRRYAVTDLVEDLRAPRSQAERIGAGVRLYEALADLVLRSRGHWSARGKNIPRALQKLDPAWADQFIAAFDELFGGRGEAVLRLAEQALAPLGGFLFEGHRLDAPPSWRKPPS